MILDVDALGILEKVNSFYDSAWNKLIIYTTILIAIIGIILPLLVTWWQNRSLKIKEESIRKDFLNEFNKQINELKENINKTTEENINKKFEDLNKKLESKLDCVDAGTFHIQGNNFLITKEFKEAIISYLAAGEKYIKGNDYYNLAGINENIENYLNELNKKMISEMELDGYSISNYLKELQRINTNGVFTAVISRLKKIYEEVKIKE